MPIDIVNQREEWITEWMHKVNTESDYEETGEGWGVDFNGDFIFEVEPDDELRRANEYAEDDVSDGVAFFAEIEDGTVHDAYPVEVDEIEAEPYGFNYHGTYSAWKELIKGRVGPIDGLMSGKFEVDGDMQKILQWSEGASSLAEASGLVDTKFPEEAAEEAQAD